MVWRYGGAEYILAGIITDELLYIGRLKSRAGQH